MSKSIEIIRKTSWDWDTSEEPTIIETCPGRFNVALVASPNRLVVYDFFEDKEPLTLGVPGDIHSASFHPSGDHISVATTYELLLANILVDGIVPFWKVHLDDPCVDCSFNRRGTVFAAICSGSIVVYDFIDGTVICKVDCNGAAFAKLKWGTNCAVHAVCEQGICKWDALSGEKLASYRPENENILAFTVTSDNKTLIASSNNSITYLNRDLKHYSTVEIGEEFILSGALCVSNESLVFVGVHHCDNVANTMIRIYSAVGGDYFDQPVRIGHVMEISADGRFLITNNALFEIKDRRGYCNQYITSSEDLTNNENCDENCSGQTEILVSKSHFDSKMDLLDDLKSRLTEVEIMNELQLRSVRQGQNDELRQLRESNHAKISELQKQGAQILHEKRNLIQSNQGSLKNAMSSHLSEIHQLEKKYEGDILNQVAEHCRLEEIQKGEALRMEEERGQLRQTQEQELAEFQVKAHEKLSSQREITSQLESQKADLERQSKESIALLEDEIDDSISLLVTNFEKEIVDERETSERLALETGILRRKIFSLEETIYGVNDRVGMLLRKEEEYNTILKKREEEREKLDAVRNSKDVELASKNDAVSRLIAINRQLSKTIEIEKDRLQEVKNLTENGPLVEKMNELGQELLRATELRSHTYRTNACMEREIAKLKECESIEQKKVVLLENKIRSYDSTLSGYLMKLEECNAAIQNPKELSKILFSTKQSFAARSPNDKKNDGVAPADQTNENEDTLLFLEKMNELDRLKEEDSALTEAFKEEKANQIAVNSALLTKLSSNAPPRRRSSIQALIR